MVAATAHPAKFEKILQVILAQDLKAAGLPAVIDVPQSLQALLNRNMARAEIQPDLRSLEQAWF